MRLLVTVLCLLVFSVCYGVSADDASRKAREKPQTVLLKEDLLCAYDKNVRPVIYHGNATFVFVSMLLRTLTFDEYSGSLNVDCWMVWEWTDEKLQWKPSDYGGVDALRLYTSEIWVPGISQLGLTSTWNVRHDIHSGMCLVDSSGVVTCVSRTVYFSICAPDIAYWPYDAMNCSVQIGAWMQTGEEIAVNTNHGIVNIYHYEPNSEWKLLSATSRRHLENSGENSTFPWIQYSFVMQRHSGMYEATIGIPALVLSSLVLLSFWLSPSEESRINILCVSLICHCVYLTYLGAKLNNTGEKSPLIVQLFRDSLLLSGVSFVVAIVLRYLVSASATPPRWVSRIIRWTLSYRAGQLFLLTKISPADAAIVEEEGEEEVGLIGTPTAVGVRGWTAFGRLLNRVCFIVTLFVYLLIFARWLT
ncbi:Neuronal acetylcholine receptor subunit beta-3 [Zootermopsis nevadensis]|uniref:Neuronal acetylcholine receptor subunit beta-3 n=1 Tax=Zootermopsis nevadensis TaxID=136037 RepID=A0A067R3K7_ZOONE|nr:Neuronal acetylcholine receptor subunit beta-3 [Zootermopsis nevadensis]